MAADEAIRTECLPASLLWQAILRRCILIRFREDNETVCKIVAAGGSAKLAHMPCTHKVNAASVAEWCGKGGHVIMEHARTDDQAADIGTKRFTDAMKWLQLLYLNGLVSPELWEATSYQYYFNEFSERITPPSRGEFTTLS